MSFLVDPPQPRRLDKLLLAFLFLLLWGLDGALTIRFVSMYGLEAEANPFVRYVMSNWGEDGLLWVKSLTGTLWALLHQRAKVWVHVATIIVMVPVVALGFLVAFS